MEPVFISFASQVEGRGKNPGANFTSSLVWGRRGRRRFSHCALEFPQPPVGAPEDFRRAAFIPAVLGNGAARDNPFKLIQEFGEGTSVLESLLQGYPCESVHEIREIMRR